jgi:hypothetical protein
MRSITFTLFISYKDPRERSWPLEAKTRGRKKGTYFDGEKKKNDINTCQTSSLLVESDWTRKKSRVGAGDGE